MIDGRLLLILFIGIWIGACTPANPRSAAYTASPTPFDADEFYRVESFDPEPRVRCWVFKGAVSPSLSCVRID